MKVVIRYEPIGREWYLERYQDGVMISSRIFKTYGQCLEAARGF